MKYFFVLLISIGFPHNSSFSQDSTNFFPSYEKQIIKSKIHNIEKEIIIGLPDNFNDSSTYPVVFVLEGELLFESLAPLTKLMAKVGEIPPCVVVGIPFFNQHLAYAPKIEGILESGNADRMLDFYRSELFPFLEDEYQCTNERIIWAHSGLGGIFCTYLLLGPDDQFSGVLSSSPNLKWMQQYITKDDAFILTSTKKTIYSTI